MEMKTRIQVEHPITDEVVEQRPSSESNIKLFPGGIPIAAINYGIARGSTVRAIAMSAEIFAASSLQ